MLRYLTILCFCLIAAIACDQGKKTDQSPTTDSTGTATAHDTLPFNNEESIVLKVGINGNSELINSMRAAKLYAKFKEKSMLDKKKFNFCDPVFRYFKCGRFIKNTVDAHLLINEESLRKITGDTVQYSGIRLYPCLDGNDIKYAIIFFKQVSGEITRYNDKTDPTPIVLIRLDKLKKRICDLKKYDLDKKIILTSHRLCTPNCPDDEDDLLFDY